MATFDPRLYGARWAENYDEWHAGLMDDEGAVAALADFAADGPVLEFGVGTGRLAVPLAERGVEVTGVDVSPEMLGKLREKSSAVTVVEGDMTTVSLGAEFAVAVIAFNSIFVLGSQDKQVELFRNAARHLAPGGRFVLETEVVRPPADGGRLTVVHVGADQVMLSGGMTDPVTGVFTGAMLVVGTDGTRFYPESGRGCTHHEMDLMAQLAGLEREDRWGDWKGTPFGQKSELHVSIYRKP